MQLPQQEAKPYFFLSLLKELTPASAAARICVSVIDLQMHIYIVLIDIMIIIMYLNRNENDCQYYSTIYTFI